MLPLWQSKLFAHIYRNAGNASDFFKLLPNDVLELGAELEI
jgi:K+ transporter